MKLIKPCFEILTPLDPKAILQAIERAGRVCYKSEDRITPETAVPFVRSIITRGHESVLEHQSITVLFICDRGVSHEMVRHRIASFSQESTRYVGSSKTEKIGILSDEDVIQSYLSGNSMKRVAELSSRTEWEIYKILQKNEVPRRGLNSKGLRNTSFFHQIDSVEKAYLLGFIQADGSIRESNSQLSITQHRDYVWFLEAMLNEFIGKVGSSIDGDCRQVSLCSRELIDDLLRCGIIQNKSEMGGKAEADIS